MGTGLKSEWVLHRKCVGMHWIPLSGTGNRVPRVWHPMVRDWQQGPTCMVSYGQGLAIGSRVYRILWSGTGSRVLGVWDLMVRDLQQGPPIWDPMVRYLQPGPCVWDPMVEDFKCMGSASDFWVYGIPWSGTGSRVMSV